MKRILKAIARALLAIPVLTWTVCAATGKMILSAVLPPQPQMTTEAGAEADEAIEGARESKPAAVAAKTDARSQAEIALTYAAACVTGSQPPNLQGQPPAFVRWLEDLSNDGARRLFKCSLAQIERHLAPRCPQDHLEGLASIGARPAAAAPVGKGSIRQNAEDYVANVVYPRVVIDNSGDFVMETEAQTSLRRVA